ncbi:MAG: hypothetical protein IID28_07545 [Planctomycetes bacterium]|nr:hypothetical protein [Planctomycetota bacterium]
MIDLATARRVISAGSNYLQKHDVRIAIICVVAVFLHRAWFIFHGDFGITWDGDEAARIAAAINSASPAGLLDVMSMENWVAIHPIGDPVLKTTIALLANHLSPVEPDYIKIFLILSVALFSFTAVVMYLTGRLFAGRAGALLVMVLIVGSRRLLEISVGSTGESSALPIFAGSLYFLVHSLVGTSRAHRSLYISASLLLAASCFRSEVVLLLPGLCLFLWPVFGVRRATAYGAIACSYTVAKIVLARLWFPGSMQYTNAHEWWVFASRGLWGALNGHASMSMVADIHPIVFWMSLCALLAFYVAPSRDSDRRIRRTVSALTACFVSLSGCLIVASALGFTHQAARLATFPLALFILIQAGVFMVWLRRMPPSAVTRDVVLGLAVVLLSTVGMVGVMKTIELRKQRVPGGFSEACAWLEENVDPQEGVLIDFLEYWEWVVHAHLITPDNSHRICSYGICEVEPLSKAQFDEEYEQQVAAAKTPLERMEARMDRVTKTAHAFIREQQPTWFVLIGTPRYDRWLKAVHVTPHNFSFIFPYTTDHEYREVNVDDIVTVQIPGADNSVTLRKVFGTQDVQIFKRAPAP